MPAPARVTFPVTSFRHLETPFAKNGWRDYFAVVEVRDLPDRSRWRKINVRDPKLTGAVPRAIRDSALNNPDAFLFMNRGIVLSVAAVAFDNKSTEVTITLTDPAVHGLLDGGHTYNAIRDTTDSLDGPQYVRVEILEGFGPEEIIDIVDARNTSNQVRDQSLMNLAGQFDKLKRALAGRPYSDMIAYKEHELLDPESGAAKPIDVREVIAILTVFDRDNLSASSHPINSYRSKAACLQHFAEHPDSYDKIYPLADDILRLYDCVQLQLPDLYNAVRARRGDVSGGKVGHLTGVTRHTGSKKAHLLFLGQQSDYTVPIGFVFPMLGAFRALLEEKRGRYVWGKGLNPFQLLEGELGETLADTIGIFAREERNPSKTGKSPLVWQSCYQAGQVAYLSA